MFEPKRIGRLHRVFAEESPGVSFNATYDTDPPGDQVSFVAVRHDNAGEARRALDGSSADQRTTFAAGATFTTPTQDGVRYVCANGKSAANPTARDVARCDWVSGRMWLSLASRGRTVAALLRLAPQAQAGIKVP